MTVPAGSLDPDKEYQFVVVLKDGQRLIPKKMPEGRLHRWLSQPLIHFVMGSGNVKFAPADVANIELVEE